METFNKKVKQNEDFVAKNQIMAANKGPLPDIRARRVGNKQALRGVADRDDASSQVQAEQTKQVNQKAVQSVMNVALQRFEQELSYKKQQQQKDIEERLRKATANEQFIIEELEQAKKLQSKNKNQLDQQIEYKQNLQRQEGNTFQFDPTKTNGGPSSIDDSEVNQRKKKKLYETKLELEKQIF